MFHNARYNTVAPFSRKSNNFANKTNIRLQNGFAGILYLTDNVFQNENKQQKKEKL